MKRVIFLTIVLALAISAGTSLVMAQPPTPSVPYLIDFQGKLTTLAGNPVPDAVHTFTFRIYAGPGVAPLLWSEGPTGIATTGGLFTHQLGSITALPIPQPGRIFSDNDQVWLEVEADGAIISPRTRLISNAYSQVANFVETDPAGIGIVTVRIPTPGTDCHISTYGAAGLEKSRIGNCLYGELSLWDLTPTLTATLTTNFSAGGELRLANPGGATTIDLHGGLTGDASAVLPTDAVNSGEILDEPGVSNSNGPGFFFLGTAAPFTYVVDSVDITIPAAGYVEVTINGYLNLAHVTGTATSWFSVPSKTRADAAIYNGVAVARVPSVIGSSSLWAFPMTSSRLFAEAAGTYRYYLNLRYETGTSTGSSFGFASIRATYFPTLYGTVTLASAAGGATSDISATATDGSKLLPETELTTITVADHKARLEVERAKQMAELEARIKKLEATVSQNKDKLAPQNR